ncbi:MAG: hypothetical protein ACRD4B_00585 [Acidobacteriota bacterium]
MDIQQDIRESSQLTVESGTYTGSWGGFTTSIETEIEWIREGQFINLLIVPTAVEQDGTSDDTSFVISAMPAFLRPSILRITWPVRVKNNGVYTLAPIRVDAAGTLTVFSGPSTAVFTASGLKGLGGSTDIRYRL